MNKTVMTGSLIGLCFGFIAWLIGFLLEDSYLSRDAWMMQHEDTLGFIENSLNGFSSSESEDAVLDAIAALEREEDASIIIVAPTALATSETAQEAQPERMLYYDVVVDDTLVLNVGLDHHDHALVPLADWLQLALLCIAIVCAVWVTAFLGNRRLRVLEDTVLETSSDIPIADTRPNTRPDTRPDPQTDPVSTAIDALQTAREQITHLQHARQSAIEDHRDLLASVAHEFRNPLARLQFANEMAMERTGEEQQALFEEANIAARELDALVRETLHYSRLRSLENILEQDTLSVSELCQEMRDQHIPIPDTVCFTVEEPTSDAQVTVDRRLIIRAMTNLVSNAARYANTRITLSTEQHDHSVMFNVIDDGPGIDAAHATRIFEPFYRVGSSRSRESGGFGLGLSIVKSICEQHDATVELKPTAVGCHFQITLKSAERPTL